MACKPISLTEHIRKNGDFYRYDDLLGVDLTGDTETSKHLKADFFDVFGF